MKKQTLVSLLVALIPSLSSTLAFAERLPIVFAHGIAVNGETYETFAPIKKTIEDAGYKTYILHSPLFGSVEERAAEIYKELNEVFPTGKFHFVGHSMGGLDARLAIHKYNLGDRVVSLTTVSTPHRGSALANFVLRHVGSIEPMFKKITDEWQGWFGPLESMHDLTPESLEAFNETVKDDPRVKYYSMGFYLPGPALTHSKAPLIWLTYPLMKLFGEGPNDGIVSVHSAKWGEWLGAYPSDHISETVPLPCLDGLNYREVFLKVVENLNDRF